MHGKLSPDFQPSQNRIGSSAQRQFTLIPIPADRMAEIKRFLNDKLNDGFIHERNELLLAIEISEKTEVKGQSGGIPETYPQSQTTNQDINHPQHYGGDTIYEAIKVIEAWGLGFNLGNAVKYIRRSLDFDRQTRGLRKKDLTKALWYLDREIKAEVSENARTITKEDKAHV